MFLGLCHAHCHSFEHLDSQLQHPDTWVCSRTTSSAREPSADIARWVDGLKKVVHGPVRACAVGSTAENHLLQASIAVPGVAAKNKLFAIPRIGLFIAAVSNVLQKVQGKASYGK